MDVRAARPGRQPTPPPPQRTRIGGYAMALAGPAAITAALSQLNVAQSRNYIFVYLAAVAALGVVSGFGPALLGAVVSFVLVDYSFVAPVHELTIGDSQDTINLAVFVGTAAVIGGLGSRRRSAQFHAEGLAGELAAAVAELKRLNTAQAEAAASTLRLAQAQLQVQLLQNTDRLRSELLANVSHELRTPLSVILTGTTDILNDPALSVERRNVVASVVGETARLSRLVSDMLDMARIEAGGPVLDLSDVDIREAVTAAADRLALVSPARPVEVVVGDEIEVLADWDRLGQILDNLLGNADRHAPPLTPIRVLAAPGKRSVVVVRVIDNGPGIPADQRDHVFERFARSGSGQQPGGGGTGLGLSIVRGLVEAHAGRVWIEEPEDGEGGRFAFTLPSAPVTTSEPERER